MNKVLLIVKREYLSRVRKRSFIVMTFLGPLLLGGFMILAIWLGLTDSSSHSVLVVDKASFFTDQMKARDNIRFFYTDHDIPNEEFEESPYTLLLYVNEKVVENQVSQLYYKKLPSLAVQSYLKEELERVVEIEKLRINQIADSTFAKIKTSIDLPTYDIKNDKEKSYKQELAIVGFSFAILIYFFIFLYGIQVMKGVMEEKSNRIVEVLISSVKPFQLMAGKIIGIALVGFTQFTLWVILTFAIYTTIGTFVFQDQIASSELLGQQMSTQLTEEKGKEISNAFLNAKNPVGDLIKRINFPLMLGMFLFYFIGGYLLYGSLFAAVGAAVDSESETQQFMLPITLPLVFAFLVAEFALQNPEGSVSLWFSIIPLTSPVVMMVRVAMGFNPDTIWQLYLSMALLIASFIFTTWLAGRIYRVGILMYGKKTNYRELWKWLWYKG